MHALRDQPCELLNGGKLILSYGELRPSVPLPAMANRVLSGDTIGLPGLSIFEEFVSDEEERELLGGLCAVDAAYWQPGISRRVQVRQT